MIDKLTFTNPSDLYDPRPNGYSHLAQIPAGWRLITPAGQGGEAANGVLSPSFREQFAQALANVRIVLAAAGADLASVAKVTLYVVDHSSEKLEVVSEEVGRAWPEHRPAMTLVPVPRLALDGMQVEIDVIAAMPFDR